MNNMGESCAGAKIERKHELDDIRVIEEASCHVKQHGEPVQSIDVKNSSGKFFLHCLNQRQNYCPREA